MVGFGSRAVHEHRRDQRLVRRRLLARKAALTIYGIHDGYAAPDPLLAELGPHTTGQELPVRQAARRRRRAVLERLVRTAWDQSLTTRKSYIDT